MYKWYCVHLWFWYVHVYIFNICSQGGVRLNVRLPCPSPDGSLLHLRFSTDTTTDTTNTANTTADTTDTTDTANTTNAANRILRGGIDDVHVVELIRDEAQINVYYATVPGELA